MIIDTLIAVFISFIVSAILCPIFIPVLHKLKFGQQVRNDGPKEHLKKSGTPTMGGIIILIALIAGCVPYINKYELILPVIFFALAFACIGFIDDYLKVVKKQSEGLKVLQKLVLQIITTSCLVLYIYMNHGIKQGFLIPLTGNLNTGIILSLGWFFIPAVFIIVLGTDNGVNFTDGLDGLCASVTVAVALFFAIAAINLDIKIAPAAGALIGSLMGFLIYNIHPAKVFMGDTGSLAIGGFIAAYALLSQMSLFIIIVGFIYLVEVLSVIIQVGYFKKTHGKRIFRMAPIHHHFELGGWSENKVVIIFTSITIVLGMIAYFGFKI